MSVQFQIYEIVKVIGEVVTPKKGWRLKGEIGMVLGFSDPYTDGHRDYGVGFNTYEEVIAISEEHLESLGRIGDPTDFVSRSSAHKSGMPEAKKREHHNQEGDGATPAHMTPADSEGP